MRTRVQCNSCHGTYAPIGPDGVVYFHTCPPLSPAELDAAVASGLVTLTKVDLDEVHGGTRTVPRPMGRDENVVSTRTRDAGVRKSDGTGVTPMVDAVVP